MMLGSWLTRVRTQRPLVHNITNVVVANTVANALLAIGASPVMAYAHEEVADMARLASALSLNIGTLNADIVTSMRIAGKAANEAGVPIIFDPVGVGATPYRTDVAKQLTSALHLTALRGNAGEIGLMVGAGGQVVGVDSAGVSESLPLHMQRYAQANQTVVIATGEYDLVTDGIQVWKLRNGDPLLSTITGSGCSLTGILGAFLGVVKPGSSLYEYAEAAISAVTCLNLAGEKAAKVAHAPGTFQAALFDALYELTEAEVDQFGHVEPLEVRI